MPTNNVDIFHGDGREGENPQNFLRAFCREMHSLTTMDNKKIACAFIDYLGASSQADLWFEDLYIFYTLSLVPDSRISGCSQVSDPLPHHLPSIVAPPQQPQLDTVQDISRLCSCSQHPQHSPPGCC